MKKTVKMAICAALIVSANLFATVNNTYAADPPATTAVAKQVSAEQLTSTLTELKNLAEPLSDEYIANGNSGTDIQNYANEILAHITMYEIRLENNMPVAALNNSETKIQEYSNLLKNAIQADTTGTDYSSLLTAVDNTLDMWNGTVAGANIAARNAQNTATDAQTRVGTLEDTVSDLQTEVGTKANTSDVYSKSAVDDKLDQKANTNDVYTKSAVDDKLNQKANTSDVYSKTESDGRYASKTGLSDEIARSTAKDVQHDVKLANHETRISANTMAIANEEAERKSEVRRIDGRIDTETATRELVDQFLYDNIVEEANMRKNTDIALNNKIDREVSRLDNRIDEVQSEARKGVAMAVATANLRMPSYDEMHKWGAAIGGGYYKGMNAISVGVFYQFNRNMNFSLTVAQCGGDFTIGYGYSIKF